MDHDDTLPNTEERLELFTSLAELLQDFLVDERPSAFFSRLLRVVIAFSRSEAGVIGEVLRDARGAPFIRTHAESDAPGDEAATARRIERDALDALLGGVLETGEAARSNKPCDEADPSELTPLGCALALPVRRGGELVGVIGLANRRGGYPEDFARLLEPVVTTCGAALEARRTHEARHAAERSLRDETSRLETLMENLTSGLLLESEERRVERVNQTFCDMFHVPVPPSALLGADCAAMAVQAQRAFRDPEAFLARIEALVAARERALGDVLELADGRVFERDFVPLYADGTYRGHYWQYRDVTRRVQAEAALVSARDAAEAASRVKSDFLARMSHEIRTPMASVVGYADLLLHTDNTPEETLDNAQRIRRNAEHLLALLDDILDVSRIEAGELRLVFEPVEPVRVFGAVDSLLRPLAAERGIELRTRLSADLPRSITSDRLRFQQILVNLVNNAIKFTDRGHVTLRATLEQDEERAWLRVDVEDTGIGIAPDRHARLFTPFSQVHDRTVARGRGTGLGLAICARLAASLGGRIDLRSAVGEGTTFTLRLPVTEREALRPTSSTPPREAR